MSTLWNYPAARRDETVVDDYHGEKVKDPYRWLEDPDSEETKAFVEAQNKISEPYISGTPVKDLFKTRLQALWDYPKYGCPFKRGAHYFHYYNTGLQNQSVLYMYDSLMDEPRVFLDPNKFAEDGTIALGIRSFSDDGCYFAYGLSESGSDWQTIKVRSVETGEDLEDTLPHAKFSCLSWTLDNKGFFYNRYPVTGNKSDGTETDTNINQKLYYHVLGTKQEDDILCYEFPDNPKWRCGAEVTDDGQYVLLSIVETCDPVNRLFYCDLQALPEGLTGLRGELTGLRGLLPVVKLIDNFEAEYEYIANDGNVFTFKTNLDSPRYKLIRIDFSKPEKENWMDVVAEHKNDVLSWAGCVHSDKLVLCYMQDVKNVVYIHTLSDGSRLAQLPMDVGSVVGYSGRRRDDFIFYQFMSFLTPGVIFHCDLTTSHLKPKVFREITVSGFDASQYEVDQVFYESHDSTRIPMFLVHRKGLLRDGTNPVLLYGYGGFNIALEPVFSISRLVFIQHLGGVLAIPNIRGGGEYGETWHRSGMGAKKQNVFDDFQMAAKYLIDRCYTNASKIAINGGSNGGLLVGACCNQAPELFGCAVAQVGVMDMLRFHLFTIGHAWCSDYGCSSKKEEFQWLYEYSPVHNIREPQSGVQYPSVLLTTGDHDDRVVPLHSLKHIATLQHVLGKLEKQKNPLMIRVDVKAGHGGGKPTMKRIEEAAEIYAFIALALKLSWQADQ